jgi:hypothetical protein
VGVSVSLVSSQLSTMKEWNSVLESRSCSKVGVPSDDGESDLLLDGRSALVCVVALAYSQG